MAQQNVVSCMKMGQVETFATLQMGGNVRGGLHSMSTGPVFCIATCQDQVGCIELTWFEKHNEESKEPDHLSSNAGNTSSSSSNSASAPVAQSRAAGPTGGERIDEKGRLRVQAHENAIACMTLNFDGTLLATASV